MSEKENPEVSENRRVVLTLVITENPEETLSVASMLAAENDTIAHSVDWRTDLRYRQIEWYAEQYRAAGESPVELPRRGLVVDPNVVITSDAAEHHERRHRNRQTLIDAGIAVDFDEVDEIVNTVWQELHDRIDMRDYPRAEW